MSEQESEARLPPGTRVCMLRTGKVGAEVNCLGVIRELGIEPEFRYVRPRPFFALFAPWGPIDPRDAGGGPGSPLRAPFPDIVITSGRITVPYLRAIKRASGGGTFTIFMQDPRTGAGAADLIWVPQHDRLRGENVLATLTSPHHMRPAVLAAARAHPDPRIAHLPARRIGLVLGGPSGKHRFEANDIFALAEIAREILHAGYGLMVTPSRRTPPAVMKAISAAVAISGAPERAFVWDGTGDNPYAQILAHASALVVTGDSVNMVGEAVSTGAPVHVYEPTSSRANKVTRFVDALAAEGHVRRLPALRPSGWVDESWSYQPIDATVEIAREIVRRYRAFSARVGGSAR